jgi:8-amino-7-oxononanoate synthase
VLKFTSALYLGMEHASDELRPWQSLTTGVPAVLSTVAGAPALAADLAALTGMESATLAPSTLHVFWDLFGIWPSERVAFYVDEAAYPVGRWGVERMAAQGAPAGTFVHHDAASLAAKLRAAGRRPVVLVDGYCPECGRMAPLAEYLAAVRRYGGWLVIDDTQALGVFGRNFGPAAPYGKGGGGSFEWWKAQKPEALVVCSMAKGFGVPMAFLAGNKRMIARFESTSETRTHSSPVSAAQVSAGERALLFNRVQGDAARRKLAQLVKRFRIRLGKAGWTPAGGLFPVQAFPIPSEKEALAIYASLLRLGVEPVLQAAGHGGQRRISFLITASHRADDLDQAADAWLAAVSRGTLRDPQTFSGFRGFSRKTRDQRIEGGIRR